MASTVEKPVKALLLSAYHAYSHAHWAAELTRELSGIQWTVMSLPPRYFRWRIRGNALSWVFSERERLSQDYDLLLATSMVDLVGLRGLLPKLASVPTVLYFHENQFAYPGSESQDFSAVELQMLTVYSALAADALVFNSAYNRDSFLQGTEDLLRKLPDHNPWQAVMQRLQDSSQVIPVPLSPGLSAIMPRQQGDRLQLL
ncbi:MAG: DUF3524 domain-containing protein, partial [Oceanisphaera sp.]|nr:DUF3524 domain-containing protein [Oceanisphaera sp.]